MSDVRGMVHGVLGDIQEQQDYRRVPLSDELRVVRDLGFSSLDVAQLIAMLELALGVDPFSNGVSILEVHTVGELCAAYESALKKRSEA